MPFYDWDDFAHLPITLDIQSFIRLNGFGGTYYIRSCQGRLCVAIDQRPAAWMEHYHQSNYLYYDPIAYASYSKNTAFFWDDILKKTQLTQKQARIMDEARPFGCASGYNIPFHQGGFDFSVFSIFGDDRPSVKARLREKSAEIKKLATRLHEAVSAVIETDRPIDSPDITERERECLLWTAKGKTNKEIGIILSISEHTVKAHLATAARKLDSHTKTQTVVEAIKRGLFVPW
ncbi:transcriptional activator protein SolR [alpha proteobacterium Q-1]|nr:autoinducer binding domain-containing protein [Iodidimonas nitroreducens]GAK33572.1 transcriptional activator protein SolR [alpha proteobacterium Q-1]